MILTAAPATTRPNRPSDTDTRTDTGAHSSFRPDIEGMRAVAVLLVVLGHAGITVFSGGYVGVDVFFVISGFLITSLLLKELSRTGRISILGFYARRATRLLPMATMVTVSTLAASWLWLPPTRFGDIAGDAVASSLYSVNYRLAVQDTQYLNADAPPSPFQHFWSLAVEEQFYVVWPLLLLAAAMLWRRGRTMNVPAVAAALSVLLAASLAASVVQTGESAPWAYFGAHTRAWELATGALLALAATGLARLRGPVAALLTWAGLAMILTSAVRFDDMTPFPGYAALLPVLGTALVIAGGCAAPPLGARRLLGLRPFQTVGRLSYGWYLWHWPFLMIGPAALSVEPSTSVNLLLAGAALAVTAVTAALVENPIRFRPSLRGAPIRGVALGGGLTACAVLVAAIATTMPPSTTGSGTAVDTRQALATDTSTEHLGELIADSNGVDDVPQNLTPRLDDITNPAVYDDGCHLEYEATVTDESCVYGDPDGDTTVVLFGDSHAANWFPPLAAIAAEQHWRLLPMTKSACPAAMVDLNYAELGRHYTECTQWRNTSLERIRQVQPDLVVMASSDGNGVGDVAGDPDRVWIDRWQQTFDAVGDTEITYLADTPNFEDPVPDCVSTHLSDATECNGSQEDVLLQPERRRLAIDAFRASGVNVVDTAEWFCADGTCPAVIGNILVYRDSHHVTPEYTTLLAPLLAARILA